MSGSQLPEAPNFTKPSDKATFPTATISARSSRKREIAALHALGQHLGFSQGQDLWHYAHPSGKILFTSMSAITVRLPKSVHGQAKLLAQSDEVSVNNFIVSAVAEKIAARRTAAWLKKQAGKHGSAEKLLKILEDIPDLPPSKPDSIASN
jgi:hypothetical protein